MLPARLVPFKAVRLIRVANLWKNTRQCEHFNCANLCKFIVQSSEAGGQVEWQVFHPVNGQGTDLQWSDRCHREIRNCCPYLRKRTEQWRSTNNSANAWRFLSVHCKTQKLHRHLSPNIGRLTLHIKRRTKCETEAKIQDEQVAK